MSDHATAGGREAGRVDRWNSGRRKGEETRQNIFLRTVYPLNPGIPHYVDFPLARE